MNRLVWQTESGGEKDGGESLYFSQPLARTSFNWHKAQEETTKVSLYKLNKKSNTWLLIDRWGKK